jgi:hypothetical protein
MHILNDENGNPIAHGGHDHPARTKKEENIALLKYMLSHNEHHAEEISGIENQLKEQGMDDAAKKISEAVEKFDEGNKLLSLALTLAKRD